VSNCYFTMDESNNDDARNEHTLSLYDIEMLPGNSSCVDCDTAEADWASLGFGVLICLRCAGHHRSLGVHISLVRSLNLDSWSPAQLLCLRNGGNNRFKAHLSTCYSGTASSSSGYRSESLRDLFESRYNNPEVLYYK
jgi:Putative GTPase activating protein for Arf